MAEPLSIEQARAEGFSEPDIEHLLELGLIMESGPAKWPVLWNWQPTTLQDLDWLVKRRRLLEAEEADLTRQHERRLRAIAVEQAWLERYADDCAAIVARELPRRADGTYARKSIDLPHGRVGLRKVARKALVDTTAFIHGMCTGAVPEALLVCLRISRTQRFTGPEALAEVQAALPEGQAWEWQDEILKTPLNEYLAQHPEASIPGVTVTPESQVFYVEKRKE